MKVDVLADDMMTEKPSELPKRTRTEASPRRLSHDVASSYITRPKTARRGTMHVLQAAKPTLAIISFGFASSAQPNHITSRNSISEEQTEASSSVTDEEAPSSSTSYNDYESGDFFVRMADNRVVPLFCECLSGREADVFLEALGDKNKDKIKKFMEKEEPEVGEYHIWVRNEDTGQITVISIKALENHFRSDRVKRVKWRHVSLDKVSIYRYSVPVITTKFRLRLVHFLSRNYRCCILCVWCFVIFFISIGIVLTVVFGSAPLNRPHNSTSNVTFFDQNSLFPGTDDTSAMPAHG